MNINHYTYRVTWSSDDNEHVGLCDEFPSLSWLAPYPEKALSGIRKVALMFLKKCQHQEKAFRAEKRIPLGIVCKSELLTWICK